MGVFDAVHTHLICKLLALCELWPGGPVVGRSKLIVPYGTVCMHCLQHCLQFLVAVCGHDTAHAMRWRGIYAVLASKACSCGNSASSPGLGCYVAGTSWLLQQLHSLNVV
jgi:hypothetical protein